MSDEVLIGWIFALAGLIGVLIGVCIREAWKEERGMKEDVYAVMGFAAVCVGIGVFVGMVAQLVYFGFWLTGATR